MRSSKHVYDTSAHRRGAAVASAFGLACAAEALGRCDCACLAAGRGSRCTVNPSSNSPRASATASEERADRT